MNIIIIIYYFNPLLVQEISVLLTKKRCKFIPPLARLDFANI